MSKHIAVLDIGTSGIRMLVAKTADGHTPQIIAKKECECKGNVSGEMTDPVAVTEAVINILEKIKQNTGLTVKSVYVNIPSSKISFVKNEAEADYGEPREITNKDVGTLLDTVTDVDIYENEKLIGVSPIQFSIDGTDCRNQVVGKTGTNLKVFANVILANRDYTELVKMCLEGAGLEVNGFVPMCIAMKWFVENSCEEDSVLLIDTGHTLTEYSVYFKGVPYAVGSIPVGGDNIASDIAQVYGIQKQEADVLKEEYNAANTEVLGVNNDIVLKTPAEDGRTSLAVSDFVAVTEARINDTLCRVADGVMNNKIDIGYIDCVVLSGEGMSNFKGIERNTEKAIRLGLKKIDFGRSMGMKNCFAYASGMILYVASQLPLGLHSSIVEREESAQPVKKNGKIARKFKEEIKKIFPGYRG